MAKSQTEPVPATHSNSPNRQPVDRCGNRGPLPRALGNRPSLKAMHPVPTAWLGSGEFGDMSSN